MSKKGEKNFHTTCGIQQDEGNEVNREILHSIKIVKLKRVGFWKQI